jgi:hypothetical protein
LCLADDNEDPDPEYEAFMDALTEDEEDESVEKTRKRHRGRFTRGTKHRPRNIEESEEEEDHYNPAEPRSSKAPDSNTRRQELLAKAAVAAGSKYSCHARALHSNTRQEPLAKVTAAVSIAVMREHYTVTLVDKNFLPRLLQQ